MLNTFKRFNIQPQLWYYWCIRLVKEIKISYEHIECLMSIVIEKKKKKMTGKFTLYFLVEKI